MITDIRIQNLRSLKDTGFISLKKLNILLGINSSGKSTFLRSFPLMTQSVSKKLREPISWFDDSMVDFGDYQTAKYLDAGNDEGITFSYKISNLNKTFPRSFFIFGERIEIDCSGVFEISITYDLNFETSEVYIGTIYLEHNDLNFKMRMTGLQEVSEIEVNGMPIAIKDIKYQWRENYQIFPDLYYFNEEEKKVKYIFKYIQFKILEVLKYLSNNRIKSASKVKELIGETLDKNRLLDQLKNFSNKDIRCAVENWTVDSIDFIRFYNLIASYHLLYYVQGIGEELYEFYKESSYIAPLRAAANRYYRNQSLQVENIDSNGANLQEYIASFSRDEMKLFNDYLRKLLGITLKVEKPKGHLSIILKTEEISNNIVDTGFGYSQILPILAKLWSSMTNRRMYILDRTYSNCVTSIEQPELHLHPALQATLADAFVNLVTRDIKDAERTQSLLIETHSPTIINRIGRRVREKNISLEDVNVLFFEKNKETRETKIRQIQFDESGQLTNWPYGFFSPTD